MLIHERARGIPRTISVMCDNALLTAFGLGRQPVNSEIVLEVARDFDLGQVRADAAEPTPAVEELRSRRSPEPAAVRTRQSHRTRPEDERPMFGVSRAPVTIFILCALEVDTNHEPDR